jgi:hypothetical protein
LLPAQTAGLNRVQLGCCRGRTGAPLTVTTYAGAHASAGHGWKPVRGIVFSIKEAEIIRGDKVATRWQCRKEKKQVVNSPSQIVFCKQQASISCSNLLLDLNKSGQQQRK